MLDMGIDHGDVVDAILNGARGNTSLKQLTIQLPYCDQERLKAAAAAAAAAATAKLRQVRPQLEFSIY